MALAKPVNLFELSFSNCKMKPVILLCCSYGTFHHIPFL